jgi:hypothetical protein
LQGLPFSGISKTLPLVGLFQPSKFAQKGMGSLPRQIRRSKGARRTIVEINVPIHFRLIRPSHGPFTKITLMNVAVENHLEIAMPRVFLNTKREIVYLATWPFQSLQKKSLLKSNKPEIPSDGLFFSVL